MAQASEKHPKHTTLEVVIFTDGKHAVNTKKVCAFECFCNTQNTRRFNNAFNCRVCTICTVKNLVNPNC